VALLGIWAFIFPAGHPMDLIYNHLIAPMFGAVKLPKNPFQRRLAFFVAGLMNIAAAVSLSMKCRQRRSLLVLVYCHYRRLLFLPIFVLCPGCTRE